MAKPLVSDALRERIQPLLPRPKERRFRFPGRKPRDRRNVLTGIPFLLTTGIAWEDWPAECGGGCGIPCKRYLRRWQRSGVWQKLHEVLPAELQGADGSTGRVPGSTVRAFAPRAGARRPARTPRIAGSWAASATS
jgi:transposase